MSQNQVNLNMKAIDLTGKKFGRLTVICKTDRKRSGTFDVRKEAEKNISNKFVEDK